MNTRIEPNDKPVFEIDAHVVLRLNAGDNLKEQFELTRGDLLTFTDDVLDPLLQEPFDKDTFFSGIALESGTILNVTRVGDEILMSAKGAKTPARLSLDQARSLSRNLELAADCFDLVSQLDDGDDDEAAFIEDGDAPAPGVDFITEEEDENPKGVVR